MPRIITALLWTAVIAALWLTVASGAFLWLAGLWDSPRIPWWSRPWQFAIYLMSGDGSFSERAYLVVAAIIASMPGALYVRFVLLSPAGGGLLRLPFGRRRAIERGDSDNHGHADYMSIPGMRALFPSAPDSDVGGVVVGEADRVDQGPAARVQFDPDNRATWSNGGNAPLLIDPCKRGSTHSMVIGGGGTFKSTALLTSLLTWTKSIFCLDPAEELADLVGAELADRGRKVMRLEIGGAGPNVLDGIDITSPLAETRLRAVVGRIIGPMSGNDKDDKFKRWGRTIILSLLAHMMWEPTIPAELKTLRALRDGLDGGIEVVRNRLRGIADTSHSTLARSLASTMWDMVSDTFSGALGNATEDTEWLASSAYGDLVSGTAYRISELAEGNLVVFCQVPQEALEHTPAVARVLVGCHLDAVFAAKGRVNGRVFFAIDEAVLIGRDPALKIARDQGRKSKITLQLFYQSEGQIEEVWTVAGKRAWFDGLSWRTYAGVQNLESARELSAILGTFGARAVSRGVNRGKSGKALEVANSSQGSNTSEHEISRDLAKPHELLCDLRDDERITLVRNRPPMRHGAAIAFRRPEMAHLLGETSYRQRQTPLLAAE
ncbi:MAG TPA: type IV secretory system conjugative DNA transfer family protein [Acetobacteraceae bacterium]|nr:type IV secretory system conjugative DNA transfer family protein [Acetobacteraceae bacterium]